MNPDTEDPPDRGWLRRALRGARPAFRDVLAISLFINILVLAIPIFVLQVYDRVVFHGGLTTLQGLVIGMGFVLGFDYVLRQARSRLFQRVAVRVDASVGRALFDRLMALPLRVLEGRSSSYWQALFRDVDVVRNALSGPSAALLVDLPFAVLFFVVVFVIAPPVAWVLLVFLPLFLLLAWRSGNVMSRAAQAERQSSLSRDGLLHELIAGRHTVKALAMGDALRPRWEDRHADAIEVALSRGEAGDGYHNLGYVMTIMTTVVVTTVGALAILDQRMTIGSLIAANMLSARMVGPMSQMVSQWRMFMQLRESLERLSAAFALPTDRQKAELALERPLGAVRLEKLSFSYGRDKAPAIEALDGSIGPGGLHGIVGSNGSGKSTLLKVIRGLYAPSEGRVLLDGGDMAQFTQRQLADWIGYLPQELTLFAGTIRENIVAAHPDATDEDVMLAARRAHAHQFVIDLPDGYGTAVAESGRGLSTGQQQRIALARAFLGNPAVLLLDEPSSNLDREAEKGLAETLRDLSRRTTVLIVTHSPVLLAACDSVLVMERGRVKLAGPAGQVLARLQPGPKPVAATADAETPG